MGARYRRLRPVVVAGRWVRWRARRQRSRTCFPGELPGALGGGRSSGERQRYEHCRARLERWQARFGASGLSSSEQRRVAPVAVRGGLAWAFLLLTTPSSAFSRIAPVLIGGASLAVLAPRRQGCDRSVEATSPAHPTDGVATLQAEGSLGRGRGYRLAAGVSLVTVYGGYFGAGSGVVMLAVSVGEYH